MILMCQTGERVSSQSSASAGAQALEAQRIYVAMKDGLCRPDALTLTSLATAYQRAGNWDRAEQVGAPQLAACVPALATPAQRALRMPCRQSKFSMWRFACAMLLWCA